MKRWCNLSAKVLCLMMGACLLLSGCDLQNAPSQTDEGDSEAQTTVKVMLDGSTWDGTPTDDGEDEPLRVYITLDGTPLIDLPFGQAHTVTIEQMDGASNTVAITPDSVFMDSANCDNHNCVDMGAVTRENLEMRVMGGFIICLPHRLSVEVRGE